MNLFSSPIPSKFVVEPPRSTLIFEAQLVTSAKTVSLGAQLRLYESSTSQTREHIKRDPRCSGSVHLYIFLTLGEGNTPGEATSKLWSCSVVELKEATLFFREVTWLSKFMQCPDAEPALGGRTLHSHCWGQIPAPLLFISGTVSSGPQF